MPKSHHILFLPGFTIKKTLKGSHLVIGKTYRKKPLCPHCGHKRLRIKDTFTRQVRYESIGQRYSTIQFKTHKFQCYRCKRYFNQRFEGIHPPIKEQQRNLRLRSFNNTSVALMDISKQFRVGQATVERGCQRFYWLHNQFMKNRPWPTVLGIDEHSFNKRLFATTFCDLKRHKVFDVTKGKSATEITQNISDIPGKERVKVVCIDLSQTYRNFVKRFFPNAFMKTSKAIIPDIKYQRGILSILKTNPQNLTVNKKHRLHSFLKGNPSVQTIYDFRPIETKTPASKAM